MRKLSLIVSFLLLLTSASGQGDKKVLSFEDAIEMAYGRSEQMKASRYAEQVSLFQKKSVASLRSPRFGLTSTYTYMADDIGFDFNGLKKPIENIMGGLPIPIPPDIFGNIFKSDWNYNIQDRSFATVNVGASFPLFMGFKLSAANKAARLNMDVSKQETRQKSNVIFSELVERYFGMSLALQVISVREQVLEGMTQHLEDAVKMEQAGVIPRVERLFVEVKVAEAKTELQKARSEARTIVTALNNTLNNTKDEFVPITSMFILQRMNDVEYFKKLAAENNPLLKQVDLKEKMAREAVRMERAAFMPEIAAMGGTSLYRYQVTNLVPDWTVGAALKFNIFDGLNREFKVTAAKRKVLEVEAIGNKAEADILTLVEKQYNEMTSNVDRLESLNVTLEFCEEYLRVKEVAFREGTAVAVDVVDARLNLAKTKIERLQAAYNFDLQLAKLLETCGVSEQFLDYKAQMDLKPVFFQ